MGDKIFVDEEVHELKLGRSFDADGGVAYHSMYYDFKPASIDTAKPAVIDIEPGNKVKVTVPHVPGASTKQTVYCGSKQPSQKDYAIIINHKTGEIILEKFTYKLNLKRTRSEKEKVPPAKKQKTETTNAPVVAPAVGSTPKNGAPSPSLPDGPLSSAVKLPPAVAKSNELSASSSSSSEADTSSSDSSDVDDDPPKPKPVPAALTHASHSHASHSHPSKAPTGPQHFSVYEDLQLSDSDSDSD
jgi:ELL-associated factor